jgi:peptidoglycan/xylan/chitin deacetylase (PgdA/CDA1 family)
VLIKGLLQCASPAGERSRLSVLIFHRVLPEPDPLFPDEMCARPFDRVCDWLKSWFNVLPLDQAVAHLKARTLPARAACITFDDGYADNYSEAMPILRRHGLTATFFIATGFLDGGRMWNDTVIESFRRTEASELDLGEYGRFDVGDAVEKRRAIEVILGKIKYRPANERMAIAEQIALAARVQPTDNLMMTSSQVKAMRLAGMQIGAHTVSHPILARLNSTQALQEIKGSKDFLENLLGEHVGLFAYPNGKPNEDFNVGTVECVRSLGFDAAVTTHWAAANNAVDVLQIPRFTPWDTSRPLFGLRMLGNMRYAQADLRHQ